MKKNLVFSAVGDNSFHKTWIEGHKNFDLMLVYYGQNDSIAQEYSKQCDYFIYRKTKSKLAVLQKLLIEKIEIFNNYDYVWCPDDDVEISCSDINILFETSKNNNLWVSQPSLIGNITMPFVQHIGTNNIRYVNFVEQMAPLFEKNILFFISHTFNETESLWGVEHVWNGLLGFPKDKIAILDFIKMNHTKKQGVDYLRFATDPLKEIDILRNKYIDIYNTDLLNY